MQPKTVLIESTDPASQGPFVVINKADFDPLVHRLFADATPPEPAPETTQKRGPGRPRKPHTEA